MQIKKAILTIDDDELILEMLKAELSDSFHVKTSTSAKHALEILEYQIPDMIILDISMPEMDGFTLCKIIKNNPEISHIPVMFLTALEESSTMVKAFQIGAVDFMIKPVNFLELQMRLNLHIEQAEATNALLAQNI